MSETTTASAESHTGSSSDKLWRFIAYYGMSEMAQRVTRLATTILLARLLTPFDLGIAATAITCFELVRSVANAGVGAAVIRATEERLAGVCLTAHRLVWTICVVLAGLQAAIGLALGCGSSQPQLAVMIGSLSGVYLLMPLALIQTYLVLRSSRHGRVAAIATVQAVADNVLTVVLAVLGCGAWAVVLPKLITCPIWVIGMRRAQSWTPDPAAVPAPAGEMLRSSLPVMGAELLAAARLQLDKVLVGVLLGVEALGIYYFIFNAGIGLSLSLTGAFANSIYPHLAEAGSNRRLLLQRLRRATVRTALPIAGVIVCQAMLAPFYVPLVFGAKWSGVAWMVAVLCAAASTRLVADAAAQALRASASTRFELMGAAAITVTSMAALAVGLRFGLATGVVAMAVASGVAQLGFAALTWRYLSDDASTLPASGEARA